MAWTDERVEILKKLWSEGLSASQIAGRLGGITRNAVIGKVHRLGLSGRATTSRSSGSRPRAEPFVSQFEELDIPLAERKTLQDLTECSCRWPIGDPQTPEFHFCNRNKVQGLPYCEFHARRAFQPPQVRRRDREHVHVHVEPAAVPAAPVAEAVKEPVEA
jgi:GcrA cell cycle regulator